MLQLSEHKLIVCGSRPPRGYCARISRAIPSHSRCYQHLLIQPSNNMKHLSRLTANRTTSNNETSHEQQHEELVYVRLETLGSSLEELSTRTINEHLLMGVLGLILDLADKPIEVEKEKQVADDLANIRMQILGSSSRLADKCREAIERFICRLVYPSCHFRPSDVGALVRPPCYEDCLLLRDVLCPNLNWSKFSQALGVAFNSTLRSNLNELDLANQQEFNETTTTTTFSQLQAQTSALTSSSSSPGYNFNSSIHFYWPHERSIRRCDLLPPLNAHLAHIMGLRRPMQPLEAHKRLHLSQLDHHKWPICSSAHLARSNSTLADDNQHADCLTSDDGIEYVGTRNHTRSGLKCQSWLAQWPHHHSR